MENSSEIQAQYMSISENRAVRSLWSPWNTLLRQCLRFGLVGVLNAAIDLLIFNILLWLFPTQNANLLTVFNVVAYGLGATNSFLLNKYWTFHQSQGVRGSQVMRFVLVTIIGICCNSAVVWLVLQAFQPLAINIWLVANMAKMIAIAVTAVISFLSMRLWVFSIAV